MNKLYFDGFPEVDWHEKLKYITLEPKSPLAEMIDAQRLLMDECELAQIPTDLLAYITMNNIAGEASEAAEFFGDITKPWKKNLIVDLSHIKMEAIDVLHFLLQLFVILGMEEEDIYSLYMRKNAINFQRIMEKMKRV